MAAITQAEFNAMLQTAWGQGLPGSYVYSQQNWEDVEQTLSHLSAQIGAIKQYTAGSDAQIENALNTAYSASNVGSISWLIINVTNSNCSLPVSGRWTIQLFHDTSDYGYAIAYKYQTGTPVTIYAIAKGATAWKRWSQLPPLNDTAGYHNSLFRGRQLGTSVTDIQYASISDGRFDDLFIGDYWTIGGVNYRIAAFDYFLNTGDTACTKHHVVMVPDSSLYFYRMNETNTTKGAYVGSELYTKNLERVKTTIKGAFPGHILTHRIYLNNAVSNGKVSGGVWVNSEVDLMCEQMVYGSVIFSPVSDGTTIPVNYRVEKSQLPLFALGLEFISNRSTWSLRDVIDAYSFALVDFYGYAGYYGASLTSGIRPYFCIF